MEFKFSRKMKELGRLPPEVLTKLFNTSNRPEQHKQEFVLMLVLWNLGKPSKIRPTVSSRQNIPAV